MNRRDYKILAVFVVLGIALFASRMKIFKPKHQGTEREVANGVITWDPVFAKIEPFLAQFHDCLKSSRPLADCEGFLTEDDDVFKDRANLIGALPVVRSAFQQVQEAEVEKISGRLLFSQVDKHEVPIFDVDGIVEYKNSKSAFHYIVVVQNNALKVNKFLIDSGP